MAKHTCHCKKPGSCEECPEWIFTFADLVMLMMGFFVILWVLKPPAGKDEKNAPADEQWLITVGEIRKGFGYEADPKSTDPVDKALMRQKLRNGPQQGAESDSERRGAIGTDHFTSSIRPGKQSSMGGKLPFDAGDANLKPQTVRALDQITEKIRGHYNIVMVKGHASLDDLPDNAPPQQRMDLSLRRAQNVADYLTAHGVQPETLRVQGCSTFEPVKQRDYNANAQAENRRVEIEVSASLVEERQDRAAKNPPSLVDPHAQAGGDQHIELFQ